MLSFTPSPPAGVPYQPFWCEENIWQLALNPVVGDGERFAVVISGASGHVACWNQRAAGRPEALVQWDYHVVLLVRKSESCVVWDLDTYLGCPVSLTTWIEGTFPQPELVPRQLHPQFLLIPAQEWRRNLRSDRLHMRTPSGHWSHPPPEWDMPGGTIPLEYYLHQARTGGCKIAAVENLDPLRNR